MPTFRIVWLLRNLRLDGKLCLQISAGGWVVHLNKNVCCVCNTYFVVFGGNRLIPLYNFIC